MADTGIELKRLKVELKQTELNVDKNELRVMDLEDEIRRVNEDSAKLAAALPALRAKIGELEKGQAK